MVVSVILNKCTKTLVQTRCSITLARPDTVLFSTVGQLSDISSHILVLDYSVLRLKRVCAYVQSEETDCMQTSSDCFSQDIQATLFNMAHQVQSYCLLHLSYSIWINALSWLDRFSHRWIPYFFFQYKKQSEVDKWVQLSPLHREIMKWGIHYIKREEKNI